MPASLAAWCRSCQFWGSLLIHDHMGSMPVAPAFFSSLMSAAGAIWPCDRAPWKGNSMMDSFMDSSWVMVVMMVSKETTVAVATLALGHLKATLGAD